MSRAAKRIADISDYQTFTVADAKAYVKSGRTRIRIKATEGVTFTAHTYAAKVAAAHSVGLAVDHYAFLHGGSGKAQAAYFLHVVAPYLKDGDRLMADCEVAGVNGEVVKDFIDRCHAVHPNYPGLIYGGPYFLRANLIGSHHGWGLVLADYTTASKPVFWPGGFPAFPREWQWTDGKIGHVTTVPGLGHVDDSIVVVAGPKPVSPRAPRDLTVLQRRATRNFTKHMNNRKHAPTDKARSLIDTAVVAATHAKDIKP